MKKTISILFLSLFLFQPLKSLADTASDAKTLFTRYINLEAAFDPSLADLYSDDALIKNKRTYPNGKVKELVFPAPKYKQMIRDIMPVAKSKGDRSTYSDVNYEIKGSAVKITAKRYSVLKKYYSPVLLLVAPVKSGTWQIVEELSESQPFAQKP
jgi:predicted DNA binding protein